MEFKDYYKILGVQKTATADEVKQAFRKLARKYHPDVSKEADATTRMVELNEANEVLSDPEKRAAYDNLGSEARTRAGQDFQPPPNWDAGFEFTDAVGGGADHSDFFEQLFGRAARGNRTRSRVDGYETGASLRGSDHHAKIELDLLDAYHGTERSISLRSARLDETGGVVHEERSLEVKIPKGIREGQHIRLAGRGSPGSGGAVAGDLLLEVQFKPDPRWRAEGRDVYQRVPLSPWEAVLGGSSTLSTPGGDAEVSFPPGWRNGRKLRLKGRGIPGKEPGDLYLELDIVLPPAVSEADRAAYTALAAAFPTFNPRPANGV
jgi:curved DNA-binding protein